MDLDLMAGHAEFRLRDEVGLNGLLVDAEPLLLLRHAFLVDPCLGRAVGLVGADEDAVGPGVADGLEDAVGLDRAEDRAAVDVARGDAARAVDFAVALADAMAGQPGE